MSSVCWKKKKKKKVFGGLSARRSAPSAGPVK